MEHKVPRTPIFLSPMATWQNKHISSSDRFPLTPREKTTRILEQMEEKGDLGLHLNLQQMNASECLFLAHECWESNVLARPAARENKKSLSCSFICNSCPKDSNWLYRCTHLPSQPKGTVCLRTAARPTWLDLYNPPGTALSGSNGTQWHHETGMPYP